MRHLLKSEGKVYRRFLYDPEPRLERPILRFCGIKHITWDALYFSPIFTYRRLRGHKIFHLFSRSISQPYTSPADSLKMKTKRHENCTAKLLHRDAYKSLLRRYDIYSPPCIFVYAAHFVTCDIDLMTRWREIRAQFSGHDEKMTTTRKVDDDNDDCISISWISCSPTKIWSYTLSNVRLRDNQRERAYNSSRIFMLTASR